METTTYPVNITTTKPCWICGDSVQVPTFYTEKYPAICSECFQAIVWAKEKRLKELQE